MIWLFKKTINILSFVFPGYYDKTKLEEILQFDALIDPQSTLSTALQELELAKVILFPSPSKEK